MGLKAKVKALRIVRRCWAEETPCVTKDDCRRLGCPYVGRECQEDALLDATALVEELWKQRKELKKRVQRGQNDG